MQTSFFPSFDTNLFSDVLLKIPKSDGQIAEFKAHKLLLCSKSRYFSLLFTRGFKEQFESQVTLPDFFDPIGFDALLKFLYKMGLDITNLSILPKILEMADYLDLNKPTEIGLMLAAQSKIKCADYKELTNLYRILKESMNRVDLLENRAHLREAYLEILRSIEEVLCINIKEIIQTGLISSLSLEMSMNLLESSLNYICENLSLSIVLEEIRIRMKAPSFLQLLAFVFFSIFPNILN